MLNLKYVAVVWRGLADLKSKNMMFLSLLKHCLCTNWSFTTKMSLINDCKIGDLMCTWRHLRTSLERYVTLCARVSNVCCLSSAKKF